MAMIKGDFTTYNDQELASEANGGLNGQGAIVESNRRLREANQSQQTVMLCLTWVMAGFALVQVALAAWGLYKMP